MADDRQRGEERREEEEERRREAASGSRDVPVRAASQEASLPQIETVDESMREVEEEERDPRRRGGSPIRGPMTEEE